MRWSFRTNGNFIDFVHTDETSLMVESVIVSLHNTSKCIDWSLPEDATIISFTIDETKYSNILITDIDFDGTAMDSQDDFETGITAMFPGLGSSPGGGSSYLSKTYAEMQALIAGNDLVPGTLYKISDRGDRGLFFQAISVNKLAKDGMRLMLCPARYSNNETDGDGNIWKGVWNSSKSSQLQKKIDTITLTGSSGTANISAAGGLTNEASFDTDLATTAAIFVSTYSADYNAQGINITSDGADIIFTAVTAGVSFVSPVITNTAGDLNGSVVNTQAGISFLGCLMVWGGLVWQNLTGTIGTAPEDDELDGTNWQLIPKESFSNNEYVELEFGVQYDIDNDWIERQWDAAGNIFGLDYSSSKFWQNSDPPEYNYCDISDWNFSSNNDGYVLFDNITMGVWNNYTQSIYLNINPEGIFKNGNNREIYCNNNRGRISNNKNVGEVSFNSNTGFIASNINNGSIIRNKNIGVISGNSNNGNINFNSNNGAIDGNSNAGGITRNQNNGDISSIGSANDNIMNNINNGNIETTTTGDISDPIVTK